MAERTDVLVAGAGPSGIMAALSAAREGATVRLIEKNAIPGGMNTAAMVGPLMGFHAGPTQVVRGLAQEVIDRLFACGGTLGHVPDPIGVAATITPVEPTLLKQVYFDMLRQAKGIQLHLGTYAYRVKAEKSWITGVKAVGKGGAREFEAGVYIDATGDGDLAALAKLPFSVGRVWDEFSQPMTLLFKMGGVDFDSVRAYVKAHPEQFILGPQGPDMPYVAISGFFDTVAHAKASGTLTINRDRVLLFQGVRPDEAIVNMTRVIKRSGVSADDLTQAELEARAQVDEIVRFLRAEVAGFSQSHLAETGDCIGVRESRHILGQYTLTEDDVLSCAAFSDSIAVCAFPIDIHDPSGQGLQWTKAQRGNCYDVPYRIMVPKKPGNLLVTGRCVSATHEAAASVRITPTVMAMGEAAGIAAAMAAKGSGAVADVDVAAVQKRVVACGGVPGRAFLDAQGRE